MCVVNIQLKLKDLNGWPGSWEQGIFESLKIASRATRGLNKPPRLKILACGKFPCLAGWRCWFKYPPARVRSGSAQSRCRNSHIYTYILKKHLLEHLKGMVMVLRFWQFIYRMVIRLFIKWCDIFFHLGHPPNSSGLTHIWVVLSQIGPRYHQKLAVLAWVRSLIYKGKWR